MIEHPSLPRKKVNVYRWNDDRRRWEYWCYPGCWVRSFVYGWSGHPRLDPENVVVTYDSTWAEPCEG